MDDKSEPLPWDYFLTEYERDLLILEIDEVILKYSLVNLEQIQADVLEIRQSFGRGNVNADF